MTRDMTKGSETKTILVFSLPLIAGNLLQQLYNIVDTLLVGRVLGPYALAAVGSSFTLMVFLTSINLGFCLGSGVVFSQLFGAAQEEDLKISFVNSFCFIGALTLFINLLALLFLDPLLRFLQIQPQVYAQTKEYLQIVLWGMVFTFLYNYFAAMLRSVGNSLAPLFFLAIAAVLNIFLDLFFLLALGWGIGGAAVATVIAQGVSALSVAAYTLRAMPHLLPRKNHFRLHRPLLGRIVSQSVLVSVQQSVMNFGILLIQGLVNSFGTAAMAAFAAGTKIDAFAYMPAQDFGNAFSTFIAQNYGGGHGNRIRRGIRGAVATSLVFCVLVSLGIVVFSPQLILLFIDAGQVEMVEIGVRYLRIEGVFYCLIGWLSLLYGFYRAVGRPGVSLILTIFSLGTRVFLSYLFSPSYGLVAIWCSIPIGWFLADSVGFVYLRWKGRQLLTFPDRS